MGENVRRLERPSCQRIGVPFSLTSGGVDQETRNPDPNRRVLRRLARPTFGVKRITVATVSDPDQPQPQEQGSKSLFLAKARGMERMTFNSCDNRKEESGTRFFTLVNFLCVVFSSYNSLLFQSFSDPTYLLFKNNNNDG